MKTCGIYGFRNMVNGKWYIGQSVDIKKRKKGHFCKLNNSSHRNSHFHNAWVKYGMDNFEFRILEEVPENMLDVRECAWISFYRAIEPQFGYNLQTGGKLNHQISEETRKKLSMAHKGKKFFEKHKEKISLALRGRTVSEEWRKKLSIAQTGKHHTEESKRKMSVKRKGKKFSEEHNAKISAWHKDRRLSGETYRKISEALKAYYNRKRRLI